MVLGVVKVLKIVKKDVVVIGFDGNLDVEDVIFGGIMIVIVV